MQGTITTMLLSFAAAQLLAGALSDSLGRKPVLVAGLGVYTLASLSDGLAGSIRQMQLQRAIQGGGAALAMVTGQALVRDLCPDLRARERVTGRLASVRACCPLLAPIVSSWLQIGFGWQASFVAMALLGTAALGSTAAIPERPAPAAASGGESAAGFWGALYRSSRLLLYDCRFVGCMLADSLSFGAFMLFVSFCGFVLQEHYALPLSAFGLVYGVSTLALLLGTELSPRLSRRLPGANRSVLRAGLAVSLLGASAQLLCARSPSLSRSLWSFVLPVAASHFGRGLLTVQTITLALEGHPQLAGAAAGLLFAVRACLAGLCVWILGLLYDAQSGAQPTGEGGRSLSASPVPLCGACICLSLLANDVCFYGCHARSRPG